MPKPKQKINPLLKLLGKLFRRFVLENSYLWVILFYFRWGHIVATYPWVIICTTFCITTVMSLGFLLFRSGQKIFWRADIKYFRVQYATDKLWIPSTSPFKSNKEWRNKHFQRNTRYENILFKGENVLTPEALQQVFMQKIFDTKFMKNIFAADVHSSWTVNGLLCGEWRDLLRYVLQVSEYFKIMDWEPIY